MDEKKANEEKKPESSTSNADEGGKPEVYKPIDDANLAAKRMEDANKEKKELLDREEQMIAKRALGGTAEAGQTTEIKEETPQEYAKKVMEGEL